MTGLRARSEIGISMCHRICVPVSVLRLRFSLALLVAAFVAAFVWPAHAANADGFVPKLEATAKENHIEVAVQVSATVGSSQLENFPLGTYRVSNGLTVSATLQAGIATFELMIYAEQDFVFVVIDMITPDGLPQKRSSVVHLKK